EEAAKKAEEEKKAQEEAERKSREEEARIREEEAAKKAEEEKAAREATARRAREEDAMLRAEESARNAAEQKAKQAEEEAAQKAREEAAQQAEAELKKAAEEDVAKKAEEEKWAKLAEEDRKASEGAGASVSVEKIAQLENSGIILLRAADAIIGVSKLIAGSLKNRLPDFAADLEGITEGIIYLPLLEGKLESARIDRLSGYLKEIENIKVMDLDISRMMAFGLQEVRCVKVILSDSSNLYLDGSMYSVWSSPHIPYDFASPVHNLKRCIRKYFETEAPFILFNAPGYDIPSQEFFIFLAGLEARGISITNLVLYGNKFEELEVLPITQAKKRGFIFAIWPWQFTECRKVRSLGDFRKVRLEPQEKDFYLADIEMELRHPGLGKQVTLYGCALKQGLAEKTRLVVLSNILPGEKSSQELAALYLNHWPNLEEAFQDYSRKIELFTYTANSQRYFNAEELNPGLAQVSSVKDLFRNYLTALDAYVRWHLLPSGYEDKEFAVAKERFYDLGVQLAKGDQDYAASFILPEAGYAFEKDLAYLSRRLNEKEIILEGKRFLIKA
ncbi:MAG: cell envelope integrity protein TolA, partial [Candidatus Omnitrophota bacterium]